MWGGPRWEEEGSGKNWIKFRDSVMNNDAVFACKVMIVYENAIAMVQRKHEEYLLKISIIL